MRFVLPLFECYNIDHRQFDVHSWNISCTRSTRSYFLLLVLYQKEEISLTNCSLVSYKIIWQPLLLILLNLSKVPGSEIVITFVNRFWVNKSLKMLSLDHVYVSNHKLIIENIFVCFLFFVFWNEKKQKDVKFRQLTHICVSDCVSQEYRHFGKKCK